MFLANLWARLQRKNIRFAWEAELVITEPPFAPPAVSTDPWDDLFESTEPLTSLVGDGPIASCVANGSGLLGRSVVPAIFFGFGAWLFSWAVGWWINGDGGWIMGTVSGTMLLASGWKLFPGVFEFALRPQLTVFDDRLEIRTWQFVRTIKWADVECLILPTFHSSIPHSPDFEAVARLFRRRKIRIHAGFRGDAREVIRAMLWRCDYVLQNATGSRNQLKRTPRKSPFHTLTDTEKKLQISTSFDDINSTELPYRPQLGRHLVSCEARTPIFAGDLKTVILQLGIAILILLSVCISIVLLSVIVGRNEHLISSDWLSAFRALPVVAGVWIGRIVAKTLSPAAQTYRERAALELYEGGIYLTSDQRCPARFFGLAGRPTTGKRLATRSWRLVKKITMETGKNASSNSTDMKVQFTDGEAIKLLHADGLGSQQAIDFLRNKFRIKMS